MQHSLKMNKSIQHVNITLLILAFVFFTIVVVSPAKALVDSQNAATTTESTQIKAVIQSYFTQRYEMQKAQIKPAGYSSIYSSVIENADSLWLQREKDRLEILQTIAASTHFNFTAYKFSLVYQKINVSGNLATVSLLESNELSYPGSSEPSLLGDLPHTITLKKNARGAWRITKDDYLDNTLRSMEGRTKADVLATIHSNLLMMNGVSSLDENTLPEATDFSNALVSPALTAYAYKRASAVAYADANWNRAGVVPNYIKNLPGWVTGWKTSYKLYPGSGQTGDCTNFVSQAIFMGTAYTDSDPNYFYPNIAHYTDWWYYDFSGATDSLVDGSKPWVRVDLLRNFLITNTGRGPYGVKKGTPAGDACGLAPGDPIFMKDSGGNWAHTVIIRAKTDDCAHPPFAWVDAHTINRRNVPLSDYFGYTWFSVHIQGYRK